MSLKVFLQAAGQGDLEAVKSLVARGQAVNEQNEFGYTALMSAARSYRVEVVDYLLRQGAGVNQRAQDGRTILQIAVGERPSQPKAQRECVQLLLRAGADANATDDSGGTALIRAAWFGCADAVQELVAHGARVDHMDSKGRTAASLARDRGHDEVLSILGEV